MAARQKLPDFSHNSGMGVNNGSDSTLNRGYGLLIILNLLISSNILFGW